MDSWVFVVVTGPDGFPQRMETEDKILWSCHFSLLTAHLTLNRGQRFLVFTISAFLPLLFCLPFLISPFLTISFSAFWLLKFSYSNPEGQMIESPPPPPYPYFKPKDCFMSCSRLPVGRKRRVHSSLLLGFDKRKLLVIGNMFGLFVLGVWSAQAAAHAHAFWRLKSRSNCTKKFEGSFITSVQLVRLILLWCGTVYRRGGRTQFIF